MKNWRSWLLSGMVLIVAVSQSSCSTESRISHYKGDGEIKANPDYGLIGGGGGYTLKFKPIKLDQPAHFTYHFTGLPRWRAGVFFKIEDSRWWEDRAQYEWDQRKNSIAQRERINVACYEDLDGTLAMSLRDAKGGVVFEFKKKLRELTWSGTELYDDRTVNFNPDGRDYILEVTINPDPILKNDEGCVLIRGGGHEPPSI